MLFRVSAGVDVSQVFQGQRRLLNVLRARGINEVTVLIPGSDYCVSYEIDGHFKYIRLRIEKEDILTRFKDVLAQLHWAEFQGKSLLKCLFMQALNPSMVRFGSKRSSFFENLKMSSESPPVATVSGLSSYSL